QDQQLETDNDSKTTINKNNTTPLFQQIDTILIWSDTDSSPSTDEQNTNTNYPLTSTTHQHPLPINTHYPSTPTKT
ncbi:12151_t:CDS:1, partial [Acaulospora morrowiae]